MANEMPGHEESEPRVPGLTHGHATEWNSKSSALLMLLAVSGPLGINEAHGLGNRWWIVVAYSMTGVVLSLHIAGLTRKPWVSWLCLSGGAVLALSLAIMAGLKSSATEGIRVFLSLTMFPLCLALITGLLDGNHRIELPGKGRKV